MILRSLSVSGVWQRDEVGAAPKLVELDLLDPELKRAVGRTDMDRKR